MIGRLKVNERLPSRVFLDVSESPKIKGAIMLVFVCLLDLQLPVQSMPITTIVLSSNPAQARVYSIHHYVIKFVSDLLQVGGFLCVLRFPTSIKLTATI